MQSGGCVVPFAGIEFTGYQKNIFIYSVASDFYVGQRAGGIQGFAVRGCDGEAIDYNQEEVTPPAKVFGEFYAFPILRFDMPCRALRGFGVFGEGVRFQFLLSSAPALQP